MGHQPLQETLLDFNSLEALVVDSRIPRIYSWGVCQKDRIINDALRTRGYYRWLVDTHFYEIVLQLKDESKLISEILN